jgi:hypothetical protein
MKIVKANPENKQEKSVKLSELAEGDVFRFAEVSFEDALTEKDEETFYMKISSSKAPEQVRMVSLDGKLVLDRDADRRVIKHEVTVAVKANI